MGSVGNSVIEQSLVERLFSPQFAQHDISLEAKWINSLQSSASRNCKRKRHSMQRTGVKVRTKCHSEIGIATNP